MYLVTLKFSYFITKTFFWPYKCKANYQDWIYIPLSLGAGDGVSAVRGGVQDEGRRFTSARTTFDQWSNGLRVVKRVDPRSNDLTSGQTGWKWSSNGLTSCQTVWLVVKRFDQWSHGLTSGHTVWPVVKRFDQWSKRHLGGVDAGGVVGDGVQHEDGAGGGRGEVLEIFMI